MFGCTVPSGLLHQILYHLLFYLALTVQYLLGGYLGYHHFDTESDVWLHGSLGALTWNFTSKFSYRFYKKQFWKKYEYLLVIGSFHGKLSSFAKKTGTAADDKGSSSR